MAGRILLIALCLGAPFVGARASDFEWLPKVTREWRTDDIAQNAAIHIVDGEAIVARGPTEIVVPVGKVVTQLTDAASETDCNEDSVRSADRDVVYEIDLLESGAPAQGPILDRLDLWNDNSSDFRNSVNVEILFSFDGETFESVVKTENLVGAEPAEQTCNLLTVDVSDIKKPVKKIRIVDKVAVTRLKGPMSPDWLEWDIVAKK